MQELKSKIAERLSEWRDALFVAEVTDVDEQNYSCIVKRGEGIIYRNVRLRAVVDASPEFMVLIPSVGSLVMVQKLGGSNELAVVMHSSISKITGAIGEKFSLTVTGDGISIDADRITINNGDNGGLVIVAALTDKINALVDAFNNHTHLLASGAVAVQGSPSAQANAAPITVPAVLEKAATFNENDYQNSLVTH